MQMRSSGWFDSIVWAKVRVIMRDKISYLVQKQIPNDDEYWPIAQLPNKLDAIDPTNIELSGKGLSSKQVSLLKDIRLEAKRDSTASAEPSDADVSEPVRVTSDEPITLD